MRLNGLLTPDPVRDLLEWLSSPDATRARWGQEKWTPLAGAMQHLAMLAETTRKSLTDADMDAMVQVDTETGWQADGAVLDALAAVERAESVSRPTMAGSYSPAGFPK